MNAEEELLSWLNRKNSKILENFKFGIKAIKSVDFVLSSKYNIILKWFSINYREILTDSALEENEFETIKEFLELKYPISLIEHDTSSKFVDRILQFSLNPANKFKTRKFTEVLFFISKHEIFQNVNKHRYKKFNALQKVILHHYEEYLIMTSSEKFALIHEKEFFDQVVLNIKEFIKRIPEAVIEEFNIWFRKMTLSKLIETMLILKKKLKYFNDVLEIEKLLFTDYNKYILDVCTDFPIHVHLVNLECALINFRGDTIFYKDFIEHGFELAKMYSEPKQYLLILIIFIELLKKYEINLKFEMDSGDPLKFIAEQIENIVSSHIEHNISEVMWLLCSTIRLNPLILEYSIFEIAAQIITRPKLSLKEQNMYDYFIITLLEMFKKLNRPEKYVANLLKALDEHLSENKILKNDKRKSLEVEENQPKKIKLIENSCVVIINNYENQENNLYFEILLKDFQKIEDGSGNTIANTDQKRNTFKNIIFAWKSSSVGKEFSKFISSLVSKPSLVIWKTILFYLKNLIEKLREHQNISEFEETSLFRLDFASALMSQYFAGSKLVEHFDKFSAEIESNIKLTKDVLKDFGNFLLNIEHNNRIVNAFLEIIQKFGMFCLIVFYYPSINEINEVMNINKSTYDFLSSDEWILIEQRIANFGDFDTKHNINILSLQKLEGKILSQNNTFKTSIKTLLSSSTFADPEQIAILFIDKNYTWLIQHLSEIEKDSICNIILKKIFENDLSNEYLKILMQDLECLKIIMIALYEYFGKIIGTKKSVLNSINFLKYKSLSHIERLELIAEKIKNTPTKHIKNLESDKIVKNLGIFNIINIASCKEDLKMEIFLLHFALYRDLLNTFNDSLIEGAYNILENLLYFKPHIKICNHISFELFISMIPPLTSNKFYELLFQNLRESEEKDLQNFLSNTLDLLNSEKIPFENQINLVIILIETLTKINNKKFKSILKELLHKFEGYFLNCIKIAEDSKDYEETLVGKTFKVFPTYLNNTLFRANKKEFEITEDFRKFCKIYIGHSIKYANEHSVRLITTALNNRELLHFDADEIQLILQKYWEQIKIKLKMERLENFDIDENTDDEKCYKEMIKLVVDNSTKIEFRNFLLEIGRNTNENNITFICRIIQQLSKLQLDKIKSAILNEYFKKINLQVILKLERDSNQQFVNIGTVIILLSTMKSLCTNREIILSLDHIDNILSFLIDINIKKFILTDNNEKKFKRLYNEMTDLCIVLIKSRHEIITDRIPQFIIIYQDLLQSLCWYKSERQKDALLSEDDLRDLAEFGAKLENIMHLLAKHEISLKRVAPYLLTFIIGLMVTDKRTTALYSEIKTHVESICYTLIKICDHRVGPFILRCTNDATRHVYENLVKEFKKYHKFKGKV